MAAPYSRVEARTPVGEAIRAYRLARGWSQERLAAECEIDHSLMSRVETGARTATPATVAALIVGLELADDEGARLYLLAGLAPPPLAKLTDGELAGLLAVINHEQRRAALDRLASLGPRRLGALLTLLEGNDAELGTDERRVDQPRPLRRNQG